YRFGDIRACIIDGSRPNGFPIGVVLKGDGRGESEARVRALTVDDVDIPLRRHGQMERKSEETAAAADEVDPLANTGGTIFGGDDFRKSAELTVQNISVSQ